jgi:protein gp37
MSDGSKIEWTDATWNPTSGCSKVSPGCARCYAERFSERFRDVPGHPFEQGFDLRFFPERLELPLSWRRPRRVFVNSMSDLFHEEIPDDFVASVFDTMERADWHQFQVLTKRSERLRDFVNRRYPGRKRAPKHIWLGVSVESEDYLYRIKDLQAAHASLRFLSVEPFLGPIPTLPLRGIRWVIVGGESGPRYRPVEAGWIRSIRDRCERASVPFFFKQWGGYRPSVNGRELDGVEWSQFPV